MVSILIAFFLLAIVISFLCSMWEAVLLSITPSYAQIKLKEGSREGKLLQSFKENIFSPVRVCTDDWGNIYFTDSHMQHGCRMDSLGQIQLKIKGIRIPMAIAVDRSHTVYISDRADSSVKMYSPEGTLIGKLGTSDTEFGIPSDIAIDTDGNIYVVDRLLI